MKTIMKLEDITTIDQLEDFLSGTQAVAFSVISNKDACYRWIQGELVRFRYLKRKRMGIYRIDPTYSGLPFLNSAEVDPSEPAPI